MTADQPRGVLDPGLRGLTIGLILTVTLVAFEALAVATALPAAEDDLGDLYLYGWTFSAFLLASLVGIAFAGERSDISGPAVPFVLGLVLFGIGLVLGGLAPSMLVLVLARAIQGLGAGAIPAVAYVSIGRAYPDALRPRMLALFATAWVVPGLVGPGVAGVVAEYLSWRLVFLGIIPFVAVAAVLALPGLRSVGPPATPAHGRSLIPMSMLLALGAGIALTGPTIGSAPVAVPFIIVGILMAIIPLRRLLPPGTLLARRGLPAAVAGTAILNFAFFGADAFIPLMLTEVRGQTTIIAGIVITITTLTWTGGSWVMERLGDRVGRGRLIRVGLLLIILGALMIIPVTASAPLWLAAVAWAIAGAGIGLAYPGFSLAALSSTTEGSEGAAATSVKTAEFLAAAGGAGIGGAIVGAGDSGGWLPESLALNFALMAAVCVPGLYAAVRLVFPVNGPSPRAPAGPAPQPSQAGTTGQ